jgi:hypothetical protein
MRPKPCNNSILSLRSILSTHSPKCDLFYLARKGEQEYQLGIEGAGWQRMPGQVQPMP